MNRYNTLGRVKYNVLGKLKYNTEYVGKLRQIFTRLGPRPIVLNQNIEQVAVLENAFDVILEQEVGGMDELTFSLPMKDSKRKLIQNEGYIQMFDTIYAIREIIDHKKDRITEVYAEAIWYDLMYAEALDEFDWKDKTAYNMMNDVLKGTGWRVGIVEFNNTRTLHVDVDKNRLEVLGMIEDLFGGELTFDTQAKKVNLLLPVGKDTGASIMYDKNADDIEARYSTRELITRIYAYGKDGLTIADANNDVPYVEDFTYTNKLRVKTIKDERYTNPFHLKEMVQQALAILSKPQAIYTIKMAELSNRTGLSHEKFFIGGIVRVYDKELELDVQTRIMKWRYNVIEPWRTELTLESKPKTLSELLTGDNSFSERLVSEDIVEKADMLNLSVFNYLMNSRADDGFVYWENNGWEIDPVNGHSGSASFKAVGESGVRKEMHQTVYPSNRDAYALSFRAHAQNIKKGLNGRVGIEVIITYEDGSKETKFIPLV